MSAPVMAFGGSRSLSRTGFPQPAWARARNDGSAPTNKKTDIDTLIHFRGWGTKRIPQGPNLIWANGSRTPGAIAPRIDREHGRHHHRMVRFLALQHGDRPRLWQALLSEVRSPGWRAGGVCDLHRGIHRPADRCRDLRPLWRP